MNRKNKAEGGMMQDEINKYKMLYSQMEKSLKQARSEKEMKQIKDKFARTTENFDGGVVAEAWKQLDSESQSKKKMAEGGQMNSLFIPPEMEMGEEIPEDTYSNIPEDEMEDVLASQKPDDEMEQDYVSYVMAEVLSEEEVDYINSALETDDKLSQIFDKLILSASEFNGAGEVEGPGDGTSDDIPARLSDGEFVFTRKATDQLGAENLQSMMDEAERAYDGGLMKKAQGGLMFNPMSAVDDPVASGTMSNTTTPSTQTQLDVQRQMLRANRMPSLIGG